MSDVFDLILFLMLIVGVILLLLASLYIGATK